MYIFSDELYDSLSGCIKTFPSFEQFLLYIATHSDTEAEPHWDTYGRLCGTCLLPYDAVVKLESMKEVCQYL